MSKLVGEGGRQIGGVNKSDEQIKYVIFRISLQSAPDQTRSDRQKDRDKVREIETSKNQ